MNGSSTSFSIIFWLINALSRRDNESLTDPSDALAINLSATSDILPFSIFDIFFKFSNKIFIGTLCKSNLWHLDIIVTGIFLLQWLQK